VAQPAGRGEQRLADDADGVAAVRQLTGVEHDVRDVAAGATGAVRAHSKLLAVAVAQGAGPRPAPRRQRRDAVRATQPPALKRPTSRRRVEDLDHRASHRIASVEEDPTDPLPAVPTSLLPVDTDLDALTGRHEVLRLLALLPPRQRQIMAWTYDGYSPTEIAQELTLTACRGSIDLDHVGVCGLSQSLATMRAMSS
jgi:RNA polymerase sigma-70 factor (ECF subfamily)